MKSLYKYISMFFVGMAVFSSCADESEIVVVEKQESERAIVRLKVQQQADREVINSRATDDENKLYDLHFYVFNENGKLTGYEQLGGNIKSPGPEDVSIRTKTGKSYIYAVANINSGSTYSLSQVNKELLNVTSGATTTMDNADLEAIVEDATLTHQQFLSVQFNRTYSAGDHQNFSPTPTDNKFMMSGYLNDGASVTIVENGIQENTDGIIKLYRILAKNTLTINTSGNGEFTPKSYRLCNVPIGGVLVPSEGISMANGVNADYTETKTGAEVESSYQSTSTSKSFTFYYPENLQGNVNGIDNWKERETNSYSSGNKLFTNAPDNAAYVEIIGDYVDENNKVTANVSYTIHLGNFSDEDRLGDFNVIRNNHYYYDVTVNGVNDIIAEAKIEADNPYAEGLVIKVGDSGEHLDVDAHYESRVMTFKKESLQALIAEGTGYILNISTPFGQTSETVNIKYNEDAGIGKVYSMTGSEICNINQLDDLFDGEADYSWMKFVKNTTSNKMDYVSDADISKYPCKYPGDNGEWLDVFELLTQLYKDAIDENNNEDEVYYTCFIDENYYANKSWSAYVNQEPRTMQIANNLSVSLDKKSVYAEVAYSISQRSIATFYTNTNRIAYGTEIIDEEDKYNVRLGDDNRNKYTYYNNMEVKSQHDWEGWTSASVTNNGQGWYKGSQDNITTYTENIQPLYKAAAKACMSRNRDSNGNGEVDEGEVKWYLASVGQYRGLYFAQDVLPADARLISEDELEEINTRYENGGWGSDTNGHNFRGKYHYYTSSDKGSAGTFWPEEGLTNNPVQASWGDSRAELVRCVRTLESNGEGQKDPELYYTYDSSTRTFNLDGIKVNRGPIDETFGVHNEIEESNEFYTSFEVASSDYNNGRTVSMSTITGGSDPCASYGDGTWRTPNQKELALMLFEISTLGTNNQNYGARTKFSGNDEGYYRWHNSPGFMTSGKVLNLAGTGTSGKIRCVRDKK